MEDREDRKDREASGATETRRLAWPLRQEDRKADLQSAREDRGAAQEPEVRREEEVWLLRRIRSLEESC